MEGYSQMLDIGCALSLWIWGPTVHTQWSIFKMCAEHLLQLVCIVPMILFRATSRCWFITCMRTSWPRVIKRKGNHFTHLAVSDQCGPQTLKSFKLCKLRAQSHLFLCNVFQTVPRLRIFNVSFCNFPPIFMFLGCRTIKQYCSDSDNLKYLNDSPEYKF